MGAEAIERADGDIRSYGRSLVGAAVPSGPSITGVPPWSPSSVMAAQSLAALLPYECGVPLAGAALLGMTETGLLTR